MWIRPLQYLNSLAITARGILRRSSLPEPLASLDGLFHPPAAPILLRPRFAPCEQLWYRNLNRLSIAYASRPRLRSRLTLGGRSFPRKPPAFGGMDFHHASRYSCRHSHFCPLHRSFRCGFAGGQNAPLPWSPVGLPAPGLPSAASVTAFSPVYCRRRRTRPVSYYALFQ